MGRAAFLLPTGVNVPLIGRPPFMMNRAIALAYELRADRKVRSNIFNRAVAARVNDRGTGAWRAVPSGGTIALVPPGLLDRNALGEVAGFVDIGAAGLGGVVGE
jgi:hypothetical protein